MKRRLAAVCLCVLLIGLGGCESQKTDPDEFLTTSDTTATTTTGEGETTPTATGGTVATGGGSVQAEPLDWQPHWPIEKQPVAYASPAAVIEIEDYSGHTYQVWGVQEKELAAYYARSLETLGEFPFFSLIGCPAGLFRLDDETFLASWFTSSRGISYVQYDSGFSFYDPRVPSIFLEEDVRKFQYVNDNWYYTVREDTSYSCTLKKRNPEGDTMDIAGNMSGEFQVANEDLYYVQDNRLWVSDLEGQYRRLVFEGEAEKVKSFDFMLMDEYVVYAFALNEGITRLYNLNTGEASTLDIHLDMEFVSDERFYYLTGYWDDSGVYRMDKETLAVEKLSDLYGRRLSLIDGKLYFATVYDWDVDENGQEITLSEDGLYRMNTDGSGLEKLA